MSRSWSHCVQLTNRGIEASLLRREYVAAGGSELGASGVGATLDDFNRASPSSKLLGRIRIDLDGGALKREKSCVTARSRDMKAIWGMFTMIALLGSSGASVSAPLCKSGFVWREAFTRDYTCVPPGSRDQARRDNSDAQRRVAPGGGAYGPNTCRQGYVWREARNGDAVCVTPDARTMTAEENRLSVQRTVSASPSTNTAAACQDARSCQAARDRLRGQLLELERRKEDKKRAVVREEQRYQATMAELRRADEEWARKHPGLGRSTQPSVMDSVTPLRNDIRDLDKAMADIQSQLSEVSRQAASASAPSSR